MNGVELVKENSDGTIAANDMLDGQIGIITRWSHSGVYDGNIVQRCGRLLVSIGYGDGKVCNDISCLCDKCRVRILKSGETIRIK